MEFTRKGELFQGWFLGVRFLKQVPPPVMGEVRERYVVLFDQKNFHTFNNHNSGPRKDRLSIMRKLNLFQLQQGELPRSAEDMLTTSRMSMGAHAALFLVVTLLVSLLGGGG